MATAIADGKPAAKGTIAAFLTPSHSWVLGKVDGFDEKSNTYTCSAAEPERMSAVKVPRREEDFFAPRLEYLEEDVDDLLLLTELHEASLLFCLKRRYLRDVVYTNIGPIVVALNPFTYDIPWYKDDRMDDYLCEGVVVERNLPHSWAVAHNTYWEMRENRCNQTILISGESGAGKTEGAKIVVRYVGILSTLHGTVADQEACSAINRKVNAASPILEAFGNAKTVRNDNSSRFGKFMKIQFNREGFLIGSHATKYLLEKSRIITAAREERVYHSFYQLAGGPDNRKFGIRGAAVHKSMKAGECVAIEGVDEAASYLECKQAFQDVGITDEEQHSIWRICAGILFAQNVEFNEREDRSGRIAEVDKDWSSALERACELWGVPEADMQRELLRATHVQRGETVVKSYDKARAYDTRDSISKGIYGWLFDWLVSRINETTDREAGCTHWIGLLDIFGFEDFTVNSFEQLCINLANETLQNHYNFYIFTEDLRECKEEGIDTTSVTFADNKGCIDLLSAQKGSVFSLLDDECKMGSGTDAGFLSKIVSAFQTTKSNAGNRYFGACSGKLKDTSFRIKHYAGEVTYHVAGFLEKNKDSLKESIKEILSKSSVELVRTLVPPMEDLSKPSAKPTVSSFFNRQLQHLMAVIQATNPHWIRCIKPHPAKKPRMFSHRDVIQQLRSAGVLATVQIRQGGYPIRFTLAKFVERYNALLTHEEFRPGSPIDARTKCGNVLQRLDLDAHVAQLGKTKVFLRQRGFLALNHAKDAACLRHAELFQRVARGAAQRRELFADFCRLHGERLKAKLRAREEAARLQREAEERRRQEEAELQQQLAEAGRRREEWAALVCTRHARGQLTRWAFARHFVDVFRANEEHANDHTNAKFRAAHERVRLGFAHVEAKELQDRRRAAERHLAATTTGGAGATTGEANTATLAELTAGGAGVDAVVQMRQRREELRVRTEARNARVEQQREMERAASERKLAAARERAKTAAAEKKRAEEAAEAKARAERRKQYLAKQEAEDARLNAAAERRAAAVRRAEERRRRVEEAQLRAMQRVAEVATSRSHGHPASDPYGGAPQGRQTQAVVRGHTEDGDAHGGSFEQARAAWKARHEWSQTREATLTNAFAAERAWRRAHASRQALVLQPHNYSPGSPHARLSPTFDALWAEQRPVSEVTGAPTQLTRSQARLEYEFRQHQAAVRADAEAEALLSR